MEDPGAFSTDAAVKRHVFDLVNPLRKTEEKHKPKWLMVEEAQAAEEEAKQERLKLVAAENAAKKESAAKGKALVMFCNKCKKSYKTAVCQGCK
jgi:hypothetical protein